MFGTLFVLGREVVQILKLGIQIRTNCVLNDGIKKNTLLPWVLFGGVLEKCPNVRNAICTWTGGRTNFKMGIQIRTNCVLYDRTEKITVIACVLLGGAGETFLQHRPSFLLVGGKLNAYKFEKWSYKCILIAY